MYVFVFCENPIYLSMYIYLSKNSDLSEKINIKICIIGKSQKTNSYKIVSQFSIKVFKYIFNFFSRHNSMTEMCCAIFKYENEKKDAEIIDLQLSSSLK